MKSSLVASIAISILLLFGCVKDDAGPNVATGTINGTVVDASTSSPLGNASVVTSPATSAVLTDASGKYSVASINPGAYTVTASRAGYTSGSVNVIVTAGGIATGRISLVPETVNLGMILVAGGTFQMGSTNGYSNEMPVHAVTVSSFWLDAKEVTVAQYRAFCTATSRLLLPAPSWGWSDDDPMVNVHWELATLYAEWVGKRLPTEAEWEYAARGGALTHGYAYSGSNTIGDVAWYYTNAGGRTQAVGTKAPNELGLYDMTGNVWEWCSDWYDAGYYSVSPSFNPKGPLAGTDRVLRGGSGINVEDYCRVAARIRIYSPSGVSDVVGFRCAKDY